MRWGGKVRHRPAIPEASETCEIEGYMCMFCRMPMPPTRNARSRYCSAAC